ncbi:MAG: bifunctional folylpolyglutamate synthase/dihydrofolate synthase [Treponema sp.]|nr:bifunctional folylpolyglutamate synthase/dihydrofolate synthase [Treponema sp.]
MNSHPSLIALQKWLDSYLNFEKLPKKDIFWLDTMEYLCQKTNNPQKAFPSVHVAGSKGKGSTSVMITSILEAAGYKSGLYSSPHILDFSERIGSAQGPLPEQVYEAAAQELMTAVEAIIPENLPGQRPITWFELVTTFAFLCFRQAKIDWAVFETGLGGRLDATNVLNPQISVITPIELEHTEFLGDTIEKIAGEKAGIIKLATPVVIAPQKEAAQKVLEAKAKELNCPLLKVKELVQVHGKMVAGAMELHLNSKLFARPITTKISLLGDYQLWNAATAALVIKTLFPELPEEAIEKGLSQATLPGRFEIIQWQGNPVVLEGAHTPNSVNLSLQTFRQYLEDTGASTGCGEKCLETTNARKPHLLFACAADKDVHTMAQLFSDFGSMVLTRPGGEKQSNPQLLQDAFTEAGHEFVYISDFKEAIQKALEQAKKDADPLLVTGSFYLVAEVKKILQETPFC